MQTPIQFAAFPSLKTCGLEWRPKSESLFGCETLTDVFVNRFKGNDATPFGRLKRLESLQILNAPLHGIQGLKPLGRLKSMRLANLRKLSALDGIEHMTVLETLEIQGSRSFTSIAPLAGLKDLEVLNISGNGGIETLAPLVGLTKLDPAP